MGFLSYLKPAKDGKKGPPAPLPLQGSTSMAMISSPASAQTTSSNSTSAVSLHARWNFMADYLRLQQVSRQWSDGADQGVVMKRSRGDYICSPPDLALVEEGFMKAVEMLNVQVWCKLALTLKILLKCMKGRNDSHLSSHQTFRWC